MTKKILWLRISYWIGAVADALVGVMILFPAIGVKLYGRADIIPGMEFKFLSGVAASLMFGWTLLLLWADRNRLREGDFLLLQ